jgi:hypothetical protein
MFPLLLLDKDRHFIGKNKHLIDYFIEKNVKIQKHLYLQYITKIKKIF